MAIYEVIIILKLFFLLTFFKYFTAWSNKIHQSTSGVLFQQGFPKSCTSQQKGE